MMKKTIFILIGLMLLCSHLSAATYYVSVTGSDNNSGTSIGSPFASIQQAVGVMAPGDICYILGGTYHEEVDLSNLTGSEGSPVTFTNYQDEVVILDGRVKIETSWTLEERASVSLPDGNNTPADKIPGIGNVYVTTLPEGSGDITQLFVENKLMTLARWPNALAYSDEVFIRGETQTLKSSAVHGEASDLADPFSLVATGVSVKGCVGLFGSVRLITAHNAGSADFSHNNPIRLESGKNYYFIEGGKDNAERVLLDSEQEWAYDESTGKLSLWPEGDVDPNGLNIYGRNIMDALKGGPNTKHIVIDGIDFFASKFDFDNSDNITIQNCDFTYYTASERALGDENPAKIADFTGSNSDFCENITVYNCTFRYSDGTGFNANYVDGLTFENNLIYRAGYYSSNEWDEYGQRRGTHAFHAYNSKGIHYRRNTVDISGTAQSVAFSRYGKSEPEKPIVSEYNFNTRCCGLETDVSSMYIPEEDVWESVVRFNWFIDNNRRDFRWDGANIDEVKTAKGNFYRNVGVQGTNPNKHAYKLKGDFHEIYNNIAIGDLWPIDIAEGNGGNASTISRNNAADNITTLLSTDGYEWDIPGDDESNYMPGVYGGTKSMRQLLCDVDNRDFRPRADAYELIDQGVPAICTVAGVEIDVTEGYIGMAPDVGAYEFGDSTYWIGGRQEGHASMPVPKNGGTNVLTDADLMYLIGLNGVKAHIYLGTTAGDLTLVTTRNDPYNIVTLDGSFALEQNKTYYWRVDTELADGTVETGDIWSFTTGEETSQNSSPGISILTSGAVAKLYVGEKSQLSAKINPPEIAESGVTWKSSNPAIATIDANGLVSTLKVGKVTITATTKNGEYSDLCRILVMQAVSGVSFASDTVKLVRGEEQQLVVNISPVDATEKSVNYSTNDASVATVTNTGLLTAHKIGTAIVTVSTKDGAFTDECIVEVTPTETANLALNGVATQSSVDYDGEPSRAIDGNTDGNYSNNSVTHTLDEENPWWQVDLLSEYNIGNINVFNRAGKTAVKQRLSNFSVKIYNAKNEEVFSQEFTSYPDLALTIQTGGVIGQVVKIQLNTSNPLSLAEVEVYKFVELSGVSITPITEDLSIGDNYQLIATVLPANASDQQLAYASSDESVATISSTGIITAVGEGKATITVTASQGEFSENTTVTVSNSTSLGYSVDHEISVYPNPANGYVHVKNLPIGSTIKIINCAGVIVASYAPQGEAIMLSTLNIEPGIYLMQINSGIVESRIKLIMSTK